MIQAAKRINVYYYTAFALIAVAISGLMIVGITSSFVMQLIIIPFVAAAADLTIKRIRFGRISYSPSATITGLILAMVLPAVPVYAQIVVGLVAIIQKHLLRIGGRHFFNPAAFGLLFAWAFFASPPAWWAVGTPLVFLFLFSDYLIGRIPLSATFYFTYLSLASVLGYFDTGLFSLDLISYPLIFFAAVMVVEPRTSAVTMKGMVIEGVALAALTVIAQQFIPIDVFVPALLLMNLIVHFRILK